MKDNEAKLEFLKAFNKVQGLIEPVKLDSENPHFHSRYASLSSVNNSIMGILTENGFTVMSGGCDIGGKPYLQTILSHIGGHEVAFTYPLSTSENPQHVSSSTTYARRVSLCALLNLSLDDDDGNAAAKEMTQQRATPQRAAERPTGQAAAQGGSVISEPQGKRLFAIAKGAGKTTEELAGYLKNTYGISHSRDLLRKDYEAACEWAAGKVEIEPIPL